MSDVTAASNAGPRRAAGGGAGGVLSRGAAGVWRWLQREGAMLLTLAFAAGGLAVATYLSFVHYTHQQIACSGIGDCDYVNSTEYAELAGMPVALLGAAAYASVIFLVLVWRFTRETNFLLAVWGVALASFAFSAYLTYIELYVIDAICVCCVVSASMATGMLAASSLAVWRSGMR